MNRTVKFISIIVSIIMILTVMAGCGAAKQEPATIATATTAAPASTTAGTEAAKVDSWTLDTSPLTVDWYVSTSDFNSTFDPAVTFAAKVLQEKTGIKINFTFPTGGDEGEKINTMIAANSLPDVVSVGQNSPEFGLLQQGGMVQPLNKLVDQYAPAFKDIVPKSLVNWYTYTDGNWYGFPCFFTPPEQVTPQDQLNTNTGFIARKEIMDKLGITQDDFKTEDNICRIEESQRCKATI
jgi:putative aldouronate transport system substrate-binding protein